MKEEDFEGFVLICRPVSPFSSPAEIETYLDELRQMPLRPEVMIEVRYTKTLLEIAKRALP